MERKRSKQYLNAKRKVSILKGFYIHLIVFIAVNLFLWFMRSNIFSGGSLEFRYWMTLNTFWFWGIGLFIHGIYTWYTIKLNGALFKDWEDKKIQEIMEQEENNVPKKRNWE